MAPFFSSKKEESSRDMIPPEVFRSVKMMNDANEPSVSKAKEVPVVKSQTTLPKGSSPFLEGEGSLGQKAPVADLPKAAPKKFLGTGLPPATTVVVETEKPKRMVWMFVVGGIILLFTVLALGYWYFVMKPAALKDLNSEKDTSLEVSATLPEEKTVPPPFSVSGPNYLSVDTEEVTLEDIQKRLNEAGNAIIGANLTQPVEFIVTDKNNNPLAFSRLAFLTNITLSPDLLSMVAENFSLFLYNDAGTIHTGISLTLANQQAVDLILKEESALPGAFQSLLYAGMIVTDNVNFRSGSYGGSAVRFANIDESKNLSFDYVVRNNEWLIGSSKTTLRALFDRKTAL